MDTHGGNTLPQHAMHHGTPVVLYSWPGSFMSKKVRVFVQKDLSLKRIQDTTHEELLIILVGFPSMKTILPFICYK